MYDISHIEPRPLLLELPLGDLTDINHALGHREQELARWLLLPERVNQMGWQFFLLELLGRHHDRRDRSPKIMHNFCQVQVNMSLVFFERILTRKGWVDEKDDPGVVFLWKYFYVNHYWFWWLHHEKQLLGFFWRDKLREKRIPGNLLLFVFDERRSCQGTSKELL